MPFFSGGIRGQLRSVIQWDTPGSGDLFFRWSGTGDEIKDASKLIVGPGQGCIFVYEGKVEGVYTTEGTYNLETDNIPFWTTITKLMQGFESEHKVGLYFFKTTIMLDQKWGTPGIVKYNDPVYKFPVGLRGFGNYSFRITQPAGFFTNVVGGAQSFTADDFRKVMGARIISPLSDYLATCGFSYADIDKNRTEISEGLKEILTKEFSLLGFSLEDFRIEGTSFDEDTMRRINRIADMSAEAQAAAAAGLNYAQLQQLDAMKSAAANPGGGAGLGMGMGAGMAFGQMMGQQFGQQPQGGQTAVSGAGSGGDSPAADDPMESLGKLKKLLDAGLISQGEFDTKKAEILARL
ncbi:MAG: SPFH domain-containing protein [Spirochaetales bacterium]|nr:SPFH domain-containing protein [Spirochaetales bacterium]